MYMHNTYTKFMIFLITISLIVRHELLNVHILLVNELLNFKTRNFFRKHRAILTVVIKKK